MNLAGYLDRNEYLARKIAEDLTDEELARLIHEANTRAEVGKAVGAPWPDKGSREMRMVQELLNEAFRRNERRVVHL